MNSFHELPITTPDYTETQEQSREDARGLELLQLVLTDKIGSDRVETLLFPRIGKDTSNALRFFAGIIEFEQLCKHIQGQTPENNNNSSPTGNNTNNNNNSKSSSMVIPTSPQKFAITLIKLYLTPSAMRKITFQQEDDDDRVITISEIISELVRWMEQCTDSPVDEVKVSIHLFDRIKIELLQLIQQEEKCVVFLAQEVKSIMESVSRLISSPSRREDAIMVGKLYNIKTPHFLFWAAIEEIENSKADKKLSLVLNLIQEYVQGDNPSVGLSSPTRTILLKQVEDGKKLKKETLKALVTAKNEIVTLIEHDTNLFGLLDDDQRATMKKIAI
jgi:hypothetical protein